MDKREPIVFELVEGEHEVHGSDDGRVGPGGRRGAGAVELLRDLAASLVPGMVRARGWVSRHRAVSLVATGVAAAVVLSAAGLGTVRERERVELLRAAPGGVESLAAPPVEAWRYAPGGDTSLLDQYGYSVGAVTMGSNVVFLEGRQRVNRSGLDDDPFGRVRWDDADLVAIDTRSGEESWRVPLGVDPECTPPEAAGAARVLDEIVCLVGRADERGVVVVTAEGEASEPRPLTPGGVLSEEVRPAWGGLVVRARSQGQPPEVNCSGSTASPTGCTVPEGETGWTVVVHAEDARTGETVWRETAPPSDDVRQCLSAMDRGDRPTIDRNPVSLWVWGGLIHIEACGVEASFHADGTMIAGIATLSGSGDLIFTDDYDEESGDYLLTVRTVGGERILRANGWVTEGTVSDGAPSDTFVLTTEQGRSLRGYRLDGSPAWELENMAEAMVAQVGPVGIFRRFDARTMGLDLRSGRVLWEWGADEAEVHDAGELVSAFTDGTSLMLTGPDASATTIRADDGAIVSRDTGSTRLVAIDARTGRTRWTVDHEDATWFAAAGRLLSIADDGALVGHR